MTIFEVAEKLTTGRGLCGSEPSQMVHDLISLNSFTVCYLCHKPTHTNEPRRPASRLRL